jgi:serine/threonine protein phosphatase PrpC
VQGSAALEPTFIRITFSLYGLCSPYTTDTLLSTCGRCPFLILACDGVWDVFTDQEAADFLLEHYFQNGSKPFESAAQLLVSLHNI